MEVSVSIIMPAYNAETYIGESILSVQRQTFREWELIIVDDGSKDTTALIAASFQRQDSRIRYLHQVNKKQGAARNLGIAHARARYIAFLDADDLWEPAKLERQFSVIQEVEADVYYTAGVVVDENDRFLYSYPSLFGQRSGLEMYKVLYTYNPVPVLSVVIKKTMIALAGPQDEDPAITGCEDLDHWLRMAAAGAVFFGIDEPLFRYRINPAGTSRNELRMKAAECAALYKNLNLSVFSHAEKKSVDEKFLQLMSFIIPSLYALKKFDSICEQFKILFEETGKYKFKLAEILFRFRLRSGKLLNLILRA